MSNPSKPVEKRRQEAGCFSDHAAFELLLFASDLAAGHVDLLLLPRNLDLLLTLDLLVHDLHLLTLRRHVRDGARLVGLLRDGGEAHVGVLLGLLLRDEVLVALGLGVAPLLGLALGGVLLHLRLADPRLLDLLGQLGLTCGFSDRYA